MKNPLISVAIPVYMTGLYLSDCIKSVVDQTYRNLDIMLLVQPCEDDSAEIAAEWTKKDVRVRIIDLPFADVSNARNEGVKNAYGELFCYVDGDDLIHREHIERMYRVMEETDADIVQAKVYAFHNQAALPEDIPGTGDVEVMTGREFELNRQKGVFGDWSTVTQTKLYKKPLFDGVEFPVRSLCDDVGTIYKIYSKAENIAVVDLESYFYRSNREGSITHDDEKRLRIARQGYVARKQMWEYFRDYDPEIASFCAYYLCNHIVRAKCLLPSEELRKNEDMIEMRKLHSSYIKECDARYLGLKRCILVRLGFCLPKLWYYLNEERTKRARRIEWAGKE